MKTLEVKKMIFRGLEVKVTKLEYSYVVEFANGWTTQIANIKEFTDIKP